MTAPQLIFSIIILACLVRWLVAEAKLATLRQQQHIKPVADQRYKPLTEGKTKSLTPKHDYIPPRPDPPKPIKANESPIE